MEILPLLRCPEDHTPLTLDCGSLVCAAGHHHPVVAGVPVLLNRSLSPLQGSIWADTQKLCEAADSGGPQCVHVDAPAFVENSNPATCGHMFLSHTAKANSIPLPDFAFEPNGGKILVDIGCNWGRWSLRAAECGYKVIGIDPNLRALLAAKTLADKHGLSERMAFLASDARCLPFRSNSIDIAFSYSVLQHFPKEEAKRSIREIGRILRIGGEALVQMPNKLGIFCLLHQLRRGFRPAQDFEVRYWDIDELYSTFRELVGVTSLRAEGFLGLGVGAISPNQVKPFVRPIVWTAKALTRFSRTVPPFAKMADSLYVSARKEPSQYS